jgi:acyl phosphate:glycerol-3-phosphate acyltransferase
MTIAFLVVVAYLIGSIPTGVIVGRFVGVDPRAAGSRNIGMTNVARTVGRGPALVTFAGDILKGAIPVACARAFSSEPVTIAAVAVAAFIGAIASIFLGFKGGKGLSAALGIWLVISPPTLLIAVAAFGIVVVSTRIMSLASMAAAITAPPAAVLMHLPREFVMLAIVMCALALIRHTENIGRLMRGEEKQFRAKSSGT